MSYRVQYICSRLVAIAFHGKLQYLMATFWGKLNCCKNTVSSRLLFMHALAKQCLQK